MDNSNDILSIVNEETFYMIDIDGVCIDTEERLAVLAHEVGWREAFRIVNWHDHIYASKQISNSLDILREVQKTLKRLQLVTLNHTKEEEKEKISFFRENGIYIPIVSVPDKVKKSEIIPPRFYDGNVVLVDDKEKNCVEWEENAGIGVLFTQDTKETKLRKVKSLDFLKRAR